ncbi:hypothetical protein QTN25_001083 [Entamoeba marina]
MVNLLRRYKKEISSTTIDEQHIILSYEYIFKCITNEITIQSLEFRQKIKYVLDQSKDMKQPLKHFIKKQMTMVKCGDDLKNKEIIDDKYFGLFAQVLCDILSTEKGGVVKVSVLQKALNSSVDIETTEETVDAEEVAQLIKKSFEKSERNDNEEKIDDVPIHGGNIDSNNSHDAFNDSMSDDSDVNDYNPNWFYTFIFERSFFMH